MKNEKGFTILEMMIVLSIIALIFFIDAAKHSTKRRYYS